ncbi:EAL domain-containing protein [Alteromonas sp. P256]|uniref:EAL domain-containing protein n=1 Tax=Alteromonas sp. P256 TaxID=3117399 RepID=UPI002FE33B23
MNEIEDILQVINLDKATFEQRKAFISLKDSDVSLLLALHEPMKRYEAELIDGFYNHLMAFSIVSDILSSETVRESLRNKQARYFLELTSGKYDLAYAKNRLLVGLAHQKIGLTAEWYIGAYGVYLAMAASCIRRIYCGDNAIAVASISALNKIALVDITLALDAYGYASQKNLFETKSNLSTQYDFQLDLHAAINRIQQSFISDMPFDDALEILLNELLNLTGSKFGLIGDVLHPSDGSPYLKVRVLTNIAWNKQTKSLYEERKKSGLEFHRQDNLLGELLRTGKPVVSNAPAQDHRAGGVPDGHPKLAAYLGLPYFHEGKLIGMIGLANRKQGYDKTLITHLKPLLDALEALYEARKLKKQLYISQQENARLAKVVKETTNSVIITDAKFDIQWCNDAFEKTSGFTLETVIGNSPLTYWSSSKTPSSTFANLTYAVDNCTDVDFEAVHQHKSHNDFWIKATCSPTFSDKGEHSGFIIIASDITESKAQRDALTNFKSVVDQTLDSVIFIDAAQFTILYTNEGALGYFAYSEALFKQLKPHQLFQFMSASDFSKMVIPLLEGTSSHLRFTSSVVNATNKSKPVDVHMQLVTTAFGQRIIIAILRDRSTQAHLEQIRANNQSHVDRLLQQSSDAIGIIYDNQFIECNDAAVRQFELLDLSADAEFLVNKTQLLSHISAKFSAEIREHSGRALVAGFQRFELIHYLSSCSSIPFEVTMTPVLYEDKTCVQTVWRDLSEIKAQEKRIMQLAYFDDLTGLANKHLFEERVTHLISLSKRYRYSIATMFLQVCNINDINETLGYGTGDLLIKAISHRLNGAIRSADTISRYITPESELDEFDSELVDREFDSLARLHCDNFALSAVVTEQSGVTRLLDRLTTLLATPFYIDNAEVSVTVKMGVAIFPNDADSYNKLLRGANIALEQAIESNEPYCYFNAELGEKIQKNALIMRRLEDTLNHDASGLSLRFQPQIDLGTNTLSGVEVLLRWCDAELGRVSPADFIPLAEERGLIDKITVWVVDAACKQLNAWEARGINLYATTSAKFAINLSARNLYSSDFLNDLIDIIHQHGLSAADFEFELTETGLMQEPEKALSLLNFLCNSGFQLAIDDFGMGHSSLSYLKDVSADVLKIDMHFVKTLLTDKANLAIVKTIISTAKIFGLKTLAEGVETAELAEALKELDCDYAQGYFYDAPLDDETFFTKWLTTHTIK